MNNASPKSVAYDELEIRLVHKRGCLQRMTGAFLIHLALRDASVPSVRVGTIYQALSGRLYPNRRAVE